MTPDQIKQVREALEIGRWSATVVRDGAHSSHFEARSADIKQIDAALSLLKEAEEQQAKAQPVVMEVMEAPRYWLYSEDLGEKHLFVLQDDHVRLLRQVAAANHPPQPVEVELLTEEELNEIYRSNWRNDNVVMNAGRDIQLAILSKLKAAGVNVVVKEKPNV